MKRWTLLLLLALLGIAVSLSAQQPPRAAQAPEAPDEFDQEFPPGPGSQFERFRMNKMLEMLQLDEQHRQTMRKLFREHRQAMQEIEKESRRALEDLTDQLHDRRADDKAIDKTLAKLDSLDIQRDRLRVEFKKEADKSLTIVQRAKLRVFMQRFERQMVEKVRGMREHMAGPRMRMPAPRPDDNDSND